MLRPYGPRHSKRASTGLDISKNAQNFTFDNCDVAQYLISEYGEKLKYRNGTLTQLAKHALICDKCKSSPVSNTAEEITNIELIAFDKAIVRLLERWKQNNAPSQRLDQCVKLLIDYYNFARKELKW